MASILEEAQSLIYGDREQDYGPPTASFENIASFWTAYLRGLGDLNDSLTLTATDVAHLMILMKVSRAQTGGMYKADNYVDIAGYAGCVERIHNG